MKKNIVSIIIFVVIVLIAVIYLFIQKPESQSILECSKTSDCKVIYSNCDCEVVPVNDPRTFLESDAVCKWNICYGTNVTAVCKNNKCARSDQ